MDVNDTRCRSPLSPVERESIASPSLPQAEEDFIILLKTLPELWNSQHEHYKNKYKRQVGYKKLLEIFKKIKHKATVEEVRKKINSLRSNYRRELRKIAASKRSGAGRDDLYTPKTKSFKLLSFLYNTEKSNNSNGQQDQRPEGTDENHDKAEPQPQTTNESEHSLSGPSFSSINTVVPPSFSNQIKKQKSLVAKQNELIDRANLFLSQTTLQSQQRAQETTISDSLAFVWAKKLDKLHPQQRFFAEKAIHDILFEAGLGNLHRFSVRINEKENFPPSRHSPSPSPTNSVINPPTPSHMQYCSGTPSPTPVILHSSSAHLPLASPSEEPLCTTPSYTQYSSAGPAQIFSMIRPPSPPNMQHSSVTPSATPVTLHSSAGYSGKTNCQKGFSSQIVISPKTNVTTSNSSEKPQDTTYYLHIPDTEEYTIGSLFRDYNPSNI